MSKNCHMPQKCPEAKISTQLNFDMHWLFLQTYPIAIFRFCFWGFDNVAMGCDTASCYTTNSNIILFLFRFAKNIFYGFWNAHFYSLVGFSAFHSDFLFFTLSNFFLRSVFLSKFFISQQNQESLVIKSLIKFTKSLY